MSRVEEFQSLTDAEDYFDFFNLDYDERLVYVKRFHIMKKYLNTVILKKGISGNIRLISLLKKQSGC